MLRLVSILFLMWVVAAPASAGTDFDVDLGNHAITPDKSGSIGDRASDSREGGESWADAIVVPGLPWTDTGATCDNVDDITIPCAAAGAPEVVYQFTPAYSTLLGVSLCGSSYDTALGIYDSNHTSIACNDDACGLQSRIDYFPLEAGATYYIVVDGYGTDCGSYQIEFTPREPCVVECPQGAAPEGEPPCGDGYDDTYNSGCSGDTWTEIHSCEVCGKSGTYTTDGIDYRDTDWYSVVGSGDALSVSCVAEFPLQVFLIYGTNCANPLYDYVTAGPCEEATLSRVIGAGQEAWIWVGPSVFTGIPCESDYTLRVQGQVYPPGTSGACCLPDGTCRTVAVAYCEALGGNWLGFCTYCDPNPCVPSPAERTTWGSIKRHFR